MSGRNPYANGYGYPSDSGRSDGGGYGSTNSLGVNGYGSGGGGRDHERRPGGYGGFYDDEQRPRTASSTTSREREGDRERGRDGPDLEQPSQSSSSRSRLRDVNTGSRWRPSRDDTSYTRVRETSRSDGVNGPRGPQSIEGMNIVHPPYPDHCLTIM